MSSAVFARTSRRLDGAVQGDGTLRLFAFEVKRFLSNRDRPASYFTYEVVLPFGARRRVCAEALVQRWLSEGDR